MRISALLYFIVAVSGTTAGQAQNVARAGAGVTVSGTVHDSLAHTPLAGAMVQLVDADQAARFGRTTVSDSLGRFSVDSVPSGRYTIGFFHPMLDSLGLASPLREVRVEATAVANADIAIPTAARIRGAICGPRSATDSVGLIVGTVRDAKDGSPVSGTTVAGEWVEFAFTPKGIVRRVPRLAATTGENGWFAICNVPSGGTMSIIASHGADSTDRVEFLVPREGFMRREMYIGAAQAVMRRDTVRSGDSVFVRPRRVLTGAGRLTGFVTGVITGQPLLGARVGIVDGPQTTTNERGEWTLADAPTGTRMLTVRAVGYYPEQRQVNVIGGAPPVRLSLATLKSVLDTVKVTARYIDPAANGFEQRRRSAGGRFFTPEDIARRGGVLVSDLFKMVPGVYLERTEAGLLLLMRSSFNSSGGYGQGDVSFRCAPSLFLDGVQSIFTLDDIDSMVDRKIVKGIEIYTDSNVPPQYQTGLGGCGAILIWTR